MPLPRTFLCRLDELLNGVRVAATGSGGRQATGATRHRVQPRLEDASLQSLATDWELICLTPLLRSPCTCVLSFQGGVRLHLYLQPSSLPSPSYPGLCAVQCGVSDLSGLRGPRRSLAGTALQLLSFVALVPAPAFWLTPNRTCFGCLPDSLRTGCLDNPLDAHSGFLI